MCSNFCWNNLQRGLDLNEPLSPQEYEARFRRAERERGAVVGNITFDGHEGAVPAPVGVP